MTTKSKAKGDRAELAVAKLISALLGGEVQRMLGAGRSLDVGDIHGVPDCTIQVKNYANLATGLREAMDCLPIQQANGKTGHGVAFIKTPKRWVVVMTPEQWARYHQAVIGHG